MSQPWQPERPSGLHPQVQRCLLWRGARADV